MPDLGNMVVRFSGNTDGLSRAIGDAKGILGNFGSGAGGLLGGVGVALAAAGVAAAGVGIASLKMAGDFQTATTTLVTGAGESQRNLQMVRDGILGIATDTGTSTKQLVAGMFMIESAGFHGAAGLDVLKVAAEGAKVGNADLGTVSNVLTTILHDYGMSGNQAAQAMNALTETVASGKTHLQDLAGSMGAVLPMAAALGISFPQVAGAIAEMTNSGMSAQRASMNLANAIRSFAAPNAAAVKSMKEVGLTAQELKDTLGTQGIAGAIQLVEEHVGKTFPANSVQAVDALKKITGGAVGYNVALMLGGKNMADYENNIKNITDAMKTGGSAVTGWALVQQDFNQKLDQARSIIEVLGIKLGEKLIPFADKAMDLFNNFTSSLVQFLTPAQKVASSVLQIVDGGKPLLDTFDRATSVLHETAKAAAPLLDTFDRGTAILKETSHVAQPMLDTFDRATAVFGHLNPAVADLNTQVNPLVQLFQELSPTVSDLVGFFENVAGTVEQFATNVSYAADHSGALQAVLKTIHDILPYVEQFIRNVADAISQKLLPPALDLIQNFSTWIDKSGLLKDAMQFLGGVVSAVATDVGGLVQKLSDLFGWLNQNKGASDAVKIAIEGIGGAILAVKVVQFGQNLVNSFQQGIKAGQDLLNNLGNIKNKIGEVGDFFAGKFKSDSEGALGGVSAEANTTSASVASIGTKAELSATEVEASSVAEDASLTTVKASAGEAALGVEAIGPAGAKGGAAAVAGLGPLQILLAGAVGNFMGFNAVHNNTPQQAWGNGGIVGEIGYLAGMSTPGGAIANLINMLQQVWGLLNNIGPGGGSIAGINVGPTTYNPGRAQTARASGGFVGIGEPFMFNEQGPELGVATPSGVQIWSHSDSMNMLSKMGGGIGSGYAQPVMYAGGGGDTHVHNHIYLDGYEMTNMIMNRAVQIIRNEGGQLR